MAWRDNELAAQAADALGDPDAVYHLSPGRTIAIGSIAMLLLLWGIVGSFLWFGVLQAGAKGLKGYFFLVLAPAGLGITMLIRMYQTRGLTVLTYPTGILVVNRGDVFSFPWDEIVFLRLGNVKDPVFEHDESGRVTTVVLPGFNSAWFGGSNTLTLTTNDARSGEIPVAVPGFTALTVRVQKETFTRLWDDLWARFQTGEPIDFGTITANLAGLSNGKKELLWDDLSTIKVSMTNIVIRRKSGVFKDWLSTPVGENRNVHLLIRLVKQMTEPPAPPATKNDTSAESIEP